MRKKPIVQIYEQYSKEDFLVWETLFDRQMANLSKAASRLYLQAIKDIGFCKDKIPEISAVNKRLLSFSGWQLTVVPELVPAVDFFRMLSERVFPVTCWLRNLQELDYLEEPDMFHDVFGHVPLLTHTDFALFMEQLGKLAMLWIDDPRAMQLLSRVYWYTVEFGLLAEDNTPRAFGAGILSSAGEFRHAIDPATPRHQFNIEQMLDMPYHTDSLQESYFIIDSFSQLCSALPAMHNTIQQRLAFILA